MELEGHPTQDLLDELERRGCAPVPGTAAGPTLDPSEAKRTDPGLWLFVPPEAFDTEIDEKPTFS